jgi:homoserine dehydrogenase
MLQKPIDNNKAKLLFTTHKTKESNMQDALKALRTLKTVDEKIAMMRIEK